ncbi:MAG: hypothetical protein ABIK92_18095 [Pseudomonadota bacterium]
MNGEKKFQKIWDFGARGIISIFYGTTFLILFVLLETGIFIISNSIFEIDIVQKIDLSYNQNPIGLIAILFILLNILTIFIGLAFGFIGSNQIIAYLNKLKKPLFQLLKRIMPKTIE